MRGWWTRSRGVPAEAYAAWRASMAERPGCPARVLSWAPTLEQGLVLLSPALASATDHDGWRHVGWHEIERGGWNSETRRLSWQTYAGHREALELPDPARVPEVFAERVAASIVFERFVPAAPGSDRGVVVSGRRDLADLPSRRTGPTEIFWHTTVTRGVTWATPGVRELADAALTQLRREYADR